MWSFRCQLVLAVAASGTIALFAGCSPTKTADKPTAENAADDDQASLSPDGTVVEFLNAVRAGDDQKASTLLTSKAREEMQAANMYVQPPGSPNAQFEIGEVKSMPEHGGAHVDSTWTDVTPSGEQRAYDITWILRKEGSTWRVAGMATKLFEDMPPLVLNFEDPTDMRAQVEAAESELARRHLPEGSEIRQATRPDSGVDGARR